MLLHTTTEEGHPAVYINGGSIAARSIYSAQIQANAIVAEHLRAGQISSDHISTAGITADNIKGKTLSSSIPVSSGGSFINLDTGNINFAGGNLTWDNTTKTFYINASTLQIGGKNVLDTSTDLAQQINNKGTTRIQGNKLHFTNQVLMDNTFIELLTANNVFAQKVDAREINANRITSGTLAADFIKGGTFDGQSMIVKNITADAIKGGTFDGQSMTIRNLSADAIVTGTLDMAKFNVANLSADIIKTGNLDITSNLNITAGDTPLLTMSTDNDILTINVNRLKIRGADMATVDDVGNIKTETQTQINKTVKSITEEYYKSTSETTPTGGSWSSSSPTWENGKYIFKRNNITFMDGTVKESTPVNITGTKGSDGNPGQDAITVVLSNEAHTFVAGVTNAEAASDIIKVDAYKGTTKVPVKIGTITGTIAGKITATIANNNTTNAQITINVTTALTEATGNITIPITVDGKSFSKVYSWSLAFKGNTGSTGPQGGKGDTGAPGANAKLVTLTSSGQIFTKPKVGAITPSKITVTASGQNTTVLSSHWQYSIDGGTFTTTKPAYVTVINATTVDIANTMSNKTLAIKVRTADAVEDTLTIACIEDGLDGSNGTDGTDATIAFLSNESHTFAGDINNAIAATDSIEATAYKGSTKQNVSIGTITGQVTGLTTAIASNNTTAPKITVTVTTALTETSGTLTIPLTVNGTIYTRYYSWSVARKGATGSTGAPGASGSDAQILTLTPNNQVFKVPKTGAITPTTITITATGQNISVPTANANWEYSVNGGTLTTTLPTGVTRSGAVVTVNGTTFTGNTLTVKVSSGTIQDTVTIYKAIDGVDGNKGDKGDIGASGQDAYTIILSNESHTFPGSTSTAVASNTAVKVIAYKGATQVVSTISSITGLVTGLTAPISGNGTTNNTFTPTATTALTQQNGTLIINLTVDGKSFTKNFSWSVSYTGSSAQLLKLTGDGQVFKVPNKGAITPTTIKVTATGENITVPTAAANWQYSVDGGTFSTTVPAGLSRTNNVVTITGTTMTAKSISIRVFSGNIQDIFTVYRIEDGISAYTHIAYADDDKGTGFSLTDTEKPYLGIYTGDSETPPATSSSYTWSLIKGRDSDAVIKITTPSYPLTTPYTQQNGLVFPTIYGNTKHSVPVGDGRNLLLNTTNTLKSINTGVWNVAIPGGNLKTLSEYGVKVGDTIRFTIYIKSTSGNGGSARISLYKADNTYTIVTGNDIKEGAEGYSTVTVQISSDIVKLVFAIQNTVGTGVTASTVQYKEEMMTKGNEEYPYTPAPEDTPQNLLSVGNDIELVSSVGSENLIKDSQSLDNQSTRTNLNQNIMYKSKESLIVGKKYILSFDIKSDVETSSAYIFLNSTLRISDSFIFKTDWTRYSVEFEYNGDTYYNAQIYPHLYPGENGSMKYIRNFKLEKVGNREFSGSNDYSPSPKDISYDTPHTTIYKTNLTLPQPLRSVGEVKDRLFRDSDGVWKVERRIGERIFNGSEGFSVYANQKTYTFGLADAITGYQTSIASHFNNKNGAWSLGSIGSVWDYSDHSNTAVRTRYFNTDHETLADFKAWVIQQYNNGTPLTVQYILNTPIIETLDKPLQNKLNSLPTYSHETWLYTANNSKTYLGEEVVPEMEGEFWGAGWAANFRIENNIIPSIDNKAESEALNNLIQIVSTESEKLSSIATDVEVTKNNFLITHTDEYVNKITTTESSIEGLESRIVSVEETKENVDTFFQFDDAFTIGKSNAQTKLRMTNDEIQFLDGETKGTYITGNTMVSQNMQIQDKLNLPKHTFETEGDITVVRYIG